MKAFVIESLLKDPGTELISTLKETPSPKPGKGEVLVEVSASGLNWFDWLQVQGQYQSKPNLPFIAGFEFAGRISSDAPIPKGCPYDAGTRVFGAAQGAYAEKVAAKWQELIPVPDELSDEEACGIFVTYPTSYAGLVEIGEVKEGEWVLVHAAAGGVGMAAVQIAKALGAKVIAACGSAEKIEVAKRPGGADHGVNYKEKDWQECCFEFRHPAKAEPPQKQVMKITGGKGANVIYDPVGLIIPSLKCVAWNGRILVIGFAGGSIEKIPANLLLLKQCSVRGVFWGTMAQKQPDKVIEVWGALLGLIADGKLKPVVYDRIYQGLEQLPTGLKALANRETYGKAVVRVSGGKASAKL